MREPRGSGERNSFVRSSWGSVKKCSGVPTSTIWPSAMNTTRSATSRAKPISWVTTIIVMPSRARSFIMSSTSLIISGSSADVGSSNSMTFGCIASARAIATRCCWPPESWPGILLRLLGDAHPLEQLHRRAPRPRALRQLAHLARRQRDVVEHGEVREEVELLEHHPRLAADLLDVADVVGQLDAVDDDAARVVLLEAVDAADHRRLARARRADDDDDLLAADAQVDVRAAPGSRRSTCRRPRSSIIASPVRPAAWRRRITARRTRVISVIVSHPQLASRAAGSRGSS